MRRRGAVLGAALALVATGAWAEPAVACDEGAHVQAARGGGGAAGRAPFVVGDSTMIFAAPVLGRLGLEADAHGCRSFAAGVGMLDARRRAGTLPHVAVLALGANGAADAGNIRRALAVLGRGRVLGLVTPRNLGSAQSAMRAAARRHPDRVVLVDWAAYSAGHDGWFAGDGLHVTPDGARRYAQLIRRRIAPYAFPPVRGLRLPAAVAGTHACGTIRRSGLKLRVRIIRGAGRVTCTRARALARAPGLHPPDGWRSYDLRASRAGPWTWALQRADRRVLVGLS